MKRYISFWLAGLVFICMSCSKEENDTFVSNEGLPTNAYIVDYTTGVSGEYTRAGANERISSLRYLLYNEAGALLKEREIPDINATTVWPLQRETMTWKQREALQDTLELNINYKVVFVANTDSKLFGAEHPEVLRYVEDYSSVRLYLPLVPFSDSNMYYWWTGEIKSSDTSHDNRYMCNVLLQRLLTKTDVSQVEIPDKEVFVDAHLEPLFASLKENLKSNIKDQVSNWSVAAGFMPGMSVYSAQIVNLRNLLSSDVSLEKMITAMKDDIMQNVLRPKIEDKYIPNWNQGENKKVEVVYENGQYANNIDFQRRAFNDGTTSIQECRALNGLFTVLGFAGTELNNVASLNFYGEDEATPVFTVNSVWNTNQGINTYYTAICDPIGQVKTMTQTTMQYTIDLRKLIQWTASDISITENLFNDFETLADAACKSQSSNFGTSFNAFILPLNLPASLNIAPTWTCSEK